MLFRSEAITHYVANRMIERERALAVDSRELGEKLRQDLRANRRRRRWGLARAFLLGLFVGLAAVFSALWIIISQLP